MFTLPDLAYDHAALEPVISRATMHLHHDKHHRAYVDALNKLLDEQGAAPASLEEVVRRAAGDPAAAKLFNNAAQAWNHTFFWTAMSPRRQAPDGQLAVAIASAFGGLAALRAAFVEEGTTHFASGWVWLAAEGASLKVLSTHDAEDLLIHKGLTPLLVCDLWEHAYYLDHKNDRKAFLEAWFDALPDWSFAQQQYAAARGEKAPWTHPGPVTQSQGTTSANAR
ncbi:MAG TPA: superoxide dismutase [Phenylobacterium sp.]|nr:superoxide dismutase [Phenylobacterium sp.]